MPDGVTSTARGDLLDCHQFGRRAVVRPPSISQRANFWCPKLIQPLSREIRQVMFEGLSRLQAQTNDPRSDHRDRESQLVPSHRAIKILFALGENDPTGPKDGIVGRPSLWIAEDFGCRASGCW